MRAISSVLFVLAALAVAPHARATPGFPNEMRSHLGLDALPACQLCHTDGGSSGSATKPFALSMKAEGLAPFDNDSLVAALDALEAAGTDSDDDGTGDIDELREGTDPNAGGGGGGGGDGPPQLQYGFGCAAARDAGALWGALAVLAWRARGGRGRRARAPASSSQSRAEAY